MSTFSDKIRKRWKLSPEEEELLDVADQARARWMQIQRELDDSTLMIAGRYENAPRVNPLIGAEARARESYLKALKALGLREGGK